MKKVKYILREMFTLIKAHKLYILTPIFIVLALLAFLVYYLGPAIVISFLYAGI